MIIPLNGLGVQKRGADGLVAVGGGMPVIALQILEDGDSVSLGPVLAINQKGEIEWVPVDESLMWGPLVVEVPRHPSALLPS